MQYLDDLKPSDNGWIIHKIIDELVNIVELCQLLQRAGELSEVQRYSGILTDVTNETLRLCRELRKSCIPE